MSNTNTFRRQRRPQSATGLADVGKQRVLDLGAGRNPDPRATETVDSDPSANPDWVCDLSEPWPWERNGVDGIVANHLLEHLPDPYHFFAEAHRVIRPRGWLEISYPVGACARGDPDHEHNWSAATAERFSEDHGRAFDRDTGFSLVERIVDVELWGPETVVEPLLQQLARRWPVWAAERATTAEVRAQYTRTGAGTEEH